MVIARVELAGNINTRLARQYRDVFAYVENSNKVKALILVLNSGGGDAASSEILMGSVKKVKSRKPVFSIIEGMGTSGAYWIASASTKIFAMNTSITGSIGVIGITPNIKEFLGKIGVRMDVTKMGEFKDMLSPFSETDEAGKAKYKGILEFSYSAFKKSVAENRNFSPDEIERIATGEIFSSMDALNLRLIDKIGTYDDALDDLIKTYGLSRKVRSYSPRRTMFERIINSSATMEVMDKFMFQ